jgi:hypothetical protein
MRQIISIVLVLSLIATAAPVITLLPNYGNKAGAFGYSMKSNNDSIGNNSNKTKTDAVAAISYNGSSFSSLSDNNKNYQRVLDNLTSSVTTTAINHTRDPNKKLQKEDRIALVSPTFTAAAYDDDNRFYQFYNFYDHIRNDENVSSDLYILTNNVSRDNDDFSYNYTTMEPNLAASGFSVSYLYLYLKLILPDAKVSFLTDVDIHNGVIFQPNYHKASDNSNNFHYRPNSKQNQNDRDGISVSNNNNDNNISKSLRTKDNNNTDDNYYNEYRNRDRINNNNAYDVLILFHQEYVTQKEYENLKEFVSNGGTIVFMDANSLFSEVKYNEKTNEVTFVKGHGWAFNGKTAWKSIGERWANDTTKWVGSNYLGDLTRTQRYLGNISFGLVRGEYQSITNPNAKVILDYNLTGPAENVVPLAQNLSKVNSTDSNTSTITSQKQSDKSNSSSINYDMTKTKIAPRLLSLQVSHRVATYEMYYKKGKVIVFGIYSDDVITNTKFLEFFRFVLLKNVLDI